ncbi:hypothetical protein [Enterococcus dispar]|uniref:hypothetical protein n=1 Tax=Enterococcus dispar TaxID=44009 RepID=UPI00288D4F4F|nr:hypothetical protein [Enterococcus dispar]MDT2704812.1 hypothetical protein [Enterococcus dispar]
MEILSNHLEKNCDKRLSGALSLSIREAYRFLDELVENEKIFQRQEMKKVWGYVRHGLVDVGLKRVLKSSNIPHEIADETSSRYPNGHTYVMIETKGAILTPAKVLKPQSVPEKAIFRDRGSLLNKQYDLFTDPEDLNHKYDENNPPFLLLTYGGSAHKLEFVRLGIPDLGVSGWIDQVDITNAPVLLTNSEDISNDLQLTFTSEAEELIRRGEKDAREKGI